MFEFWFKLIVKKNLENLNMVLILDDIEGLLLILLGGINGMVIG